MSPGAGRAPGWTGKSNSGTSMSSAWPTSPSKLSRPGSARLAAGICTSGGVGAGVPAGLKSTFRSSWMTATASLIIRSTRPVICSICASTICAGRS
jgi:hypothetical protein